MKKALWISLFFSFHFFHFFFLFREFIKDSDKAYLSIDGRKMDVEATLGFKWGEVFKSEKNRT